MSALLRGLRAFGRFWLEFLIGDTPELAVATLVVVLCAFALSPAHLAAVILVPGIAVAALALSAWRGRARRPR